MAVTPFGSTPQIVAEPTFNITALGANTTTELTFTLGGVQPGMTFIVTPESALNAGVVISHAYCTTAGSLIVRFGNLTAGSITPGNTVFHVLGL